MKLKIFFLIFFWMTIPLKIFSTDSQKILYIPAFIGNLNFDIYPDTVIIEKVVNQYTFPKYIIWGRPLLPSNDFDSNIVYMTKIEKPNWKNFHSSVSFNKYNLNDSLMDIKVAMEGLDTNNSSNNDTNKIIVLFGQNQISKMNNIILNSFETIKITPFHAITFRNGIGYSIPKIRDKSERIAGRRGGDRLSPRLLRRVSQAAGRDQTEIRSIPVRPVSRFRRDL